MDPCAATSVSKYNYNQCVRCAALSHAQPCSPCPRARFELIPAWYNYLDAHPGFMPHGQTAYALRLFNDGGNGTVGAPKVSSRVASETCGLRLTPLRRTERALAAEPATKHAANAAALPGGAQQQLSAPHRTALASVPSALSRRNASSHVIALCLSHLSAASDRAARPRTSSSSTYSTHRLPLRAQPGSPAGRRRCSKHFRHTVRPAPTALT